MVRLQAVGREVVVHKSRACVAGAMWTEQQCSSKLHEGGKWAAGPAGVSYPITPLPPREAKVTWREHAVLVYGTVIFASVRYGGLQVFVSSSKQVVMCKTSR